MVRTYIINHMYNEQTVVIITPDNQLLTIAIDAGKHYEVNPRGTLLDADQQQLNDKFWEYTRVFRLDLTTRVLQELAELAPDQRHQEFLSPFSSQIDETHAVIISSETWLNGWVGMLQKDGSVLKIATTNGFA